MGSLSIVWPLTVTGVCVGWAVAVAMAQGRARGIVQLIDEQACEITCLRLAVVALLAWVLWLPWPVR